MGDGGDKNSLQERLELLKITSDEPIIVEKDDKESAFINRRNTSPWEIDLIVETMMSHLSYESLRVCFSVSWFWRKKAFAESKSRVVLRNIGPQITDIEKLCEELTSYPTKPMKLNKLIMNHLPINQPLLHKSFKLLGLYLDTLMLMMHQKPQDLFHALTLLPNLSELQILPLPPKWEGCKLNYPLHDPITSEPYIFGNIRCLEFVNISQEPNNLSQKSCLSDICKIFPNLVALSVFNLTPEDKQNFKKISFTKLKNLKISDYSISMNNALKLLENLDLKLCQLQFIFTPSNESKRLDVDLFKKFVETQRDTLQTFDLVQHSSINHGDPCHDQTFCPFPLDLPHLKTLHIQKPFIRNITPIFDALPSLVEAKICVPTGYNWKGVLPPKIKKVYPNLQVLRVDHMEPVMFGDMSKYFPSLKLLQINCCTNPDKGLFNNCSKVDPESVLSQSTVSVCKCDKECGPGTYNINMQLLTSMSPPPCHSHIYYDYVRVTRNSKISKALDHWKEIDILIAGNCIHSPPGICFIYNDKDEIERSLKKSDLGTLGFQGKLQWTRWEASNFAINSHRIKSYNWMTWSPLTLDSVFVPFDDYVKATIPEHLVLMQTTPELLICSSYAYKSITDKESLLGFLEAMSG